MLAQIIITKDGKYAVQTFDRSEGLPKWKTARVFEEQFEAIEYRNKMK